MSYAKSPQNLVLMRFYSVYLSVQQVINNAIMLTVVHTVIAKCIKKIGLNLLNLVNIWIWRHLL